MHIISSSFLLAAFVAYAGTAAAQSCPTVWTTIATDLKTSFLGDDGNCNDDARAAIRASFHDCFPGSCDGSLILANECTDRGENSQMVGICSTLGDMATQYNVSTADMIQFGAAMGIAACPLGPKIAFKVGRTDSSTANAANQIPGQNADAATSIAAFQAKGFTVTELVALVGAHSTAKNLAGASLDSTPEQWDTAFYSETADESNSASLASDRYLSNSTDSSAIWATMADATTWTNAFVPAMEKMSIMGNDEASLIDCSSVITTAFA
ncbi:heme peroxidase [Biscogniauxia sp. FL1348]|nr:heme peroxidase [Biscogniauxia sp. FL1348]